MEYDSVLTEARDGAVDALENGLRSAQGLISENERLEEEIASGRWSDEAIREYKRQIDHNKVTGLENTRKTAMDAALSYIDKAEEVVRQSALPDSKEISDDIYLLNAGLKLSERELEALFLKPENQNHTMKRLLLQYAEEYGIEPPFDMRTWDDGSREALNALQAYRGIVKQLCYQGSAGSAIKSHFRSPQHALKSGLVRKCFMAEE